MESVCLLLPINLQLFVLGLLSGFLVSLIWEKKGIPDFLNLLPKWLAAIEHYHVALLLLLIAKHLPFSEFLYGFSVALIVEERFQEHPFAIGKDTEKISLLIGIILLFLLCFF